MSINIENLDEISLEENFIEGTENTDVIKTSKTDDIVYSEGGDDTIRTGKGDDIIDGGDGDDVIKSGKGDDIVIAGEGDDIVRTGKGDDIIDGGDGDDIIQAGKGDDILIGGEGDDVLKAGKGEDTAVFSGNFSDYLISNGPTSNSIYIEDIREGSPDGKDTVYSNVEILQFADGQYNQSTGVFTEGATTEGIVYEADPVSALYIQSATGELTQILESNLLNVDGSSVDISEFLNGGTLLVAYTIPQTQIITLGDLFNFTTNLHPEMFSMQELPIMTTNGNMTSMVDVSSMMSGMMSIFMGMNMPQMDGMPMSEDMMNSFMPMMESFMGSMPSMGEMPIDDFMGMMQGMMDIISQDGMMDDISAMTESMMLMMQESMSMMPMESFSSMMATMMETFPAQLENSQNPLEDMSQAMGAMMLTFMADMNGVANEDAIAEFGSSMGEMLNQFMFVMGGGSENPSAAIGTMMGEMMGSMMTTMADGAILSMNSFSSMMSGMMNDFMGDMAGMSEMLMGMGDFEAIIAQMQEVQNSLMGFEEMLPSNLYVQMSDGSLVNIRETDLRSADSMSVDITQFLGGSELLVGYTIPNADMMNVSDLMTLTTLTQNDLFAMSEMPMFTLESGDASMEDMSSMLTQMMGMFTMDADGMPMGDGVSDAFMDMMQNFMSAESMSNMPVDEMMGMMNEMMTLMSSSGSMDMTISMPESMMAMMSESMSAMPLEEMSAMMNMMMQTFTNEMTTSDDPLVDMANTMGSMMYSFMNGMSGGSSATPAQDFALSMGEMVNQFMIGMTGGNEDPAAVMGDMLSSMMNGMMSGMTGMTLAEGENSVDAFSSAMNQMMSGFMDDMAMSSQQMMDPMTDMLNSMMSGVDGGMQMFEMMFNSANQSITSMVEMSPELMSMMLSLSDDIGAMAGEITTVGGSIVDMQVVMSSNYLELQTQASELMLMMAQDGASIEAAMGSETFAQMMANIELVSTSMTAIEDMGTLFPSNLFVQGDTGVLSQIPETDLQNADGSAVDISGFVNGDMMMVAYTIPTTSQMNLGDLLSMTTMLDSNMFSMQDLPIIPTDAGMISVEQMSSMMNSMIGMFMGGQFMDADGMPLDMDIMEGMMGSMMDPTMMENMLTPFMDMMDSFMSGMDMSTMMPMMEAMSGSMMNTGMMDSMAGMMDNMMEMMSTTMSAMPVAQFGDMMGVMMDTFTEEFTSSHDPFENMANTMGSMMYEFMNGMTGNDSEAPAQEFALTMGEMINQFMVGMTGGNEDPAQMMGDMMGSMMGGMMSGMTGDAEAPLESFTTSMSNMMGSFMTNMSTSMVTVMDPMTDMMNTMMSGMDGNMEIIASMFQQANDTAGLMIEQSPLYMETMLRLSDDIGSMADRIGDMADNIVDTQIIQSSNFLATQDNALELIETLMGQESMLVDMMGQINFDSMMTSLQGSIGMLDGLSQMVDPQDMSSLLYVVDADGMMSQVNETDLMNAMQNSVNIEEFLNGSQLLVGYTIPTGENMSLGDMMAYTSIIEDGYSMPELPMFSLDGISGDTSIMDMSTMLNSMMGMFLGAQSSSGEVMPIDMSTMESMMSGMMDPSAMSSMMDMSMMNPAMMENMNAPFMEMMNSFMGSMDGMPMEEFNTMMSGMMDAMLNSDMIDSMAGMMDNMMEMMSTTMSAMPVAQFGDMMGVMMDTFTEEFTSSHDPFENMANTMGSMMYEFMNGMTGNDSEAPAQEFALTMGEMINQFMVGMTGGNEDPAQMMGDMMGSMMGGMMSGMTGDAEAPLESFTTSMSNMMGSFMTNMSTSMVTVMDPMTDMMNTMMSGMDGNMEIIASMFQQANDTAGLMIEQSPLYMETMLRLSDDIGSMADRIGDMADNIVDTQIIQSSNFLATQDNALELIETLMGQESMLVDMMGQMNFDSMMASLQGSADVVSGLISMSESFPSTLYAEDIISGDVTQILEADILNADGSSVDITQILGSDTLLVGYTIPNAQTMDLGSLLSLTTMIEGGTFSLEDLPMIPTDDGSMISISEMSSMMKSMMGMFMGSQMTSTDGSMMDMSAMQDMMAPFMDMMGSFMGGMNMDSMMPMMSGMMETMIEMMSNPEMMDSMTGMSSSMMDMMSTSMSAMPIDSFGSMAGALMDTFTQEILLDGNPMDNMANTMGSMMISFMDGMTGNDSEAPAQEFALTMGEMINQFMVGVTGGNEDPAAAMGDMMGSMMGGMMAGMTGDHETPLDSFTGTMSNMMGSFMTDMATSTATVMAPMDNMLSTFINGIDGNMVFIESMFNTANDTALSLIEQSPEYMTTILRLSDDIGLMANRINEMSDRIVDTQVIQSENFLATQANSLALIEMLTRDEARFIAELGADSFNLMMDNLTSAQASMDSLMPMPEVSMDDIFASQLYMQEADGSLVKISEDDLAMADGSADITSMLNGNNLLVGYTIPNAENMNLSELLSVTTMIQSSGMDMSQMPMFSLTTGDSSIMDMSGMMESMMGMFMGSGMISTDDMSPDMMTAFSDMMNSFMSGMDTDSMVDMDQFNTMMDSMMSSGMTDSMMDMSNSMMDMMGSSMSAMPMDSFSYMMSNMMESFGEIFTAGDSPMDAMAHTMGSMMLNFMAGMTGNDSEAPAGEFARTMGEMMNQFMVGVTGTNQDSAAAMGDMMGSMMGSFMISITGDAEEPMESFANSMSNMMGSMMTNMSESAAIVIDPMADMMNTFLVGIDGNMEFIASMFDTANGTMQSMIELSPVYMDTILRLSDDIGSMADRIDYMADNIVDTIELQSTNFEITQADALELMDMLSANAPEYEALLGDSFITMMSNLGKIETSMMDISDRVMSETATIFPSDLYIQEMQTGELIKMSEEDLMSSDGSYVDISSLIDSSSMMVAYTIPMSDTMTLADLMSMTTMVEGSDFSMDMLPMFGENNSIVDINSFMSMMLDPETLSMMSMPVEQFNESMITYQEQMTQSDSPFDAMGQTIGSMMMSFMEGMTQSESEQTPELFAETMGEMMREFMIGATGGNEEPAAAMGDMMGSMMGSFMISMTNNNETPMTEFSGIMSDMMHNFSVDMTQSALIMIDPTLELMGTVVNGINGNMNLIASMFDSANGTVQALIEQSPVYLDTMVRLSDDIGLMADRINDMADKIVETEVILSDTFLTTQTNSLEVMDTINEQSEYFISIMGQVEFDAMMANFISLDDAMGGAIQNMMIPDNSQMSSALYLETQDGQLVKVSEENVNLESMLTGATLLVGYTVPSSENMTLSELIDNTIIVDESVDMEDLPMFNLDGVDASAINMSEMMNSMMSLMMGQNMGVPLDELVSEPFMNMMESFAKGMGLEVDTFMMMMNQMMDTMMISDMMDSMVAMANQMIESMSFSMGGVEVNTFNDMMGVMMNTFMADGSPMATMADMMGSMMMSIMGEVTSGENNTIDEMAFQMGSMMQAFFVGVTGVSSEDGSPAMAMGDMMGSMMNSFMSSVTGSGESFADVMDTMMDRFMSDMSESMIAISAPMMDNINTLLNGMDANMELIGSMMEGANETVGMALDLTPEYMAAMTSLSNDIVEMAGRVDEMVDKIDTTAQLQLDNMSATQDNVFALIELIGDNPAFDMIVDSLKEAKNLIIPEVSVVISDVVFEQGIMSVTDASLSELFRVSSFDSAGTSADLYEYNLGFSGVDNLLVEFNSSISNLSFNLELANYISVDAFDSNQNKIELDSSNFSVDSTVFPSVITITGVNNLKYISVDSGTNSAFTLSLNSIENIALTDLVVNDIPQELTCSVALDQVSQEEMSVPVSINGLLSEVTIPAGETSVDFSMNIEDDLLSQGLDNFDISLEMPSEDALYALSADSSGISSMISELSIQEIPFDMPSESVLDSVELFALVEQGIGILDLTNSLSETITIDTTELFSDTADDSLNSMLAITGDSGDSVDINADEWSEIGTADGFTEYASTKDITVTLQIEDDLTVV